MIRTSCWPFFSCGFSGGLWYNRVWLATFWILPGKMVCVFPSSSLSDAKERNLFFSFHALIIIHRKIIQRITLVGFWELPLDRFTLKNILSLAAAHRVTDWCKSKKSNFSRATKLVFPAVLRTRPFQRPTHAMRSAFNGSAARHLGFHMFASNFRRLPAWGLFKLWERESKASLHRKTSGRIRCFF